MPAKPGTNPRRIPAHLSVCLRHSTPNDIDQDSTLHAPETGRLSQEATSLSDRVSPLRTEQLADAKSPSKWFHEANKYPGAGRGEIAETDEPPYFLRRASSSSSNQSDSMDKNAGRQYNEAAPSYRSGGNGSCADDFRSVIDDLTIENKKLKERLRKYEKSSAGPLEKDKLFEVRIHGLPARKRRELEDTLRAFASSINTSSSGESMPKRTKGTKHAFASLSDDPSFSSTINSRRVDSAYASMSASGPSGSNSNLNGREKYQSKPAATNEQNIRSFLHDIPGGLLPKQSPVMTEKVKRKLVVRRLEQLFTGKGNVGAGSSHPQQQQEISRLATKADRQAQELRGQATGIEGVREAHILSPEMDIDQFPPGKLPQEPSTSSNSDGACETSSCAGALQPSPEQRPTRPLDLDPDRAQNPSENMEYIRHLGLDTPNLTKEEDGDVAPDADGWVYLNLLINMAQLHIINVTPDFVRSALSNVSEKFQISHDGRKVRWRGGTRGTMMSSDSGASSALHGSPDESDNSAEESRKRRKFDSGTHIPPNLANGKGSTFLEVPSWASASKPSSRPSMFHYKPILRHSSSTRCSDSLDDSNSRYSCSVLDDSRTGASQHLTNWRHGSRSTKRRRDDGAIVFYSGALFCTDLSADRGEITAPLHVTEVGKDGYSNRTHDALGCSPQSCPRPSFSRTPSGSTLHFRPMKDYSALGETSRPKTPELTTETTSADAAFSPQWTYHENIPQYQKPTSLDACGLGGTQPADHFIVNVKTERSILDETTRTKLSKFSAPNINSRRIVHGISRSALESFDLRSFDPKNPRPAEDMTQKFHELPVKTRITDIKTEVLQPSELPPPAMYIGASSTEDDSIYGTDSEDEFGREHKEDLRRIQQMKPDIQTESFGQPMDIAEDGEESDVEMDEGDDDDDESIDMLGHMREVDPATVLQREQEFERETGTCLAELPAGSSAAMVDDDGSGFSSPNSSIYSV